MNLQRVWPFIHGIHLYPIDITTTETYGKLKAQLVRHFGPKDRASRTKVRLEQLGIGENDLWIAAIALRHNLTVVSSDSDFTRMRKAFPLMVENWLEPGQRAG